VSDYLPISVPNNSEYTDADFHSVIRSGGDPNASDAHEIWSGTSRGAVAVFDDGVRYDHPDIARNIWINQGEIPYSVIHGDANTHPVRDIDADALITFWDLNDAVNFDRTGNDPMSVVKDLNGNGFVDAGDLLADSRWADVDSQSGLPTDTDGNGFANDLVGWDFVSNDNNPIPRVDDDNHGTQVAGIIGATVGKPVGASAGDFDIVGVAPRIQIVPIRVTDTLNDHNEAWFDAMSYVTDLKLDYKDQLDGTTVLSNGLDHNGANIVSTSVSLPVKPIPGVAGKSMTSPLLASR
jgi:subtilisin family serine protease